MDAIASQGLAIGSDLAQGGLIVVAVLCLWALQLGDTLEIEIKIPSLISLNLKVWPAISQPAVVPQDRDVMVEREGDLAGSTASAHDV